MLVLFAGVGNQSGGERYMEWRADQPLTWDDFKGPKDPESTKIAMTKSKLKYNWGCDEGEFKFTVIARFDRGSSWKRDGITDHILAHEQLHFDITELYARKMRKLVANLENPCELSSEEMKEKLTDVLEKWDARQKQYDRESHHSKDHEQQEVWDKMIAKELKSLEKYASV